MTTVQGCGMGLAVSPSRKGLLRSVVDAVTASGSVGKIGLEFNLFPQSPSERAGGQITFWLQ
jgi:hypothetical protein